MNTKEQKDNLSFFTKWTGLRTLGFGMMVVGFISVWAIRRLFFIGVILLAAGFAVYLVGCGSRSTENDIRETAKRRCLPFSFAEVEEDHHFHLRHRPNTVPDKFAGYIYRDGLYMKKSSSGALLTSEYIYAEVFPLTDALYVKLRVFSLIADQCEEKTLEIMKSDIRDIRVEKKDFCLTSANLVSKRENGHRVKVPAEFRTSFGYLCILYGENDELLLPWHDDIYAGEIAETYKKLLGM